MSRAYVVGTYDTKAAELSYVAASLRAAGVRTRTVDVSTSGTGGGGADVGPADVAVLFAGAVSIPRLFGGAYLTLSSERAAQAVELLGARAAVPVHFEGWGHFTQGAAELRAAFAGYGVADRLALPERGETVIV